MFIYFGTLEVGAHFEIESQVLPPPPKLKQSLLVTNKLLKFILLDYRLKCIFFKDF